MVPRWTDQGIGIRHLAAQHRLHSHNRTPRSKFRDLETARAKGGHFAGIAAACGTHGADFGDMGAGVEAGQFVFGGRARL